MRPVAAASCCRWRARCDRGRRFDGIIVQCTRAPKALCDGPQQIPGDQFADFAREVVAMVDLMGKSVG